MVCYEERFPYFEGTLASFNWDTSQTTAASVLNQYHLSDQFYNICVRRARGYCSICYSPEIIGEGIVYIKSGSVTLLNDVI